MNKTVIKKPELLKLPEELGGGDIHWPFTRLTCSLEDTLAKNGFNLLRRSIELSDSQGSRDKMDLSRTYYRGLERAGSTRMLHLPVYQGKKMDGYGQDFLGDELWDFFPSEVTWLPNSDEDAKPIISSHVLFEALSDGTRGNEEIFYEGKNFHVFLDVDEYDKSYSARIGGWLNNNIASKKNFKKITDFVGTRIEINEDKDFPIGNKKEPTVYYQFEVKNLALDRIMSIYQNVINHSSNF